MVIIDEIGDAAYFVDFSDCGIGIIDFKNDKL